MIEDTFLHKGLRKKLVEVIKSKKIDNERVIEAISSVPRHIFMDNAFLHFAYEDKAFPIGDGQTISQPYTVAFQSALLNPMPGEKVLEIGTGSGYQTAVLCELGAKVYSIERQKNLYLKAKRVLKELKYNPLIFFGDGYEGKSQYAPYDGILVTCGAKETPEKLLKQLKIGGRMIIPVGAKSIQKMLRINKIDENSYETEEHGTFKFVPMLDNKVSF